MDTRHFRHKSDQAVHFGINIQDYMHSISAVTAYTELSLLNVIITIHQCSASFAEKLNVPICKTLSDTAHPCQESSSRVYSR